MYIRKILILTAAIGLVFMGSFAFYVYKVMFKANTSFEGDFKYIYIKSGTSYNQFLNQIDPYLLSVSSLHIDPIYVVWSRNDEDDQGCDASVHLCDETDRSLVGTF